MGHFSTKRLQKEAPETGSLNGATAMRTRKLNRRECYNITFWLIVKTFHDMKQIFLTVVRSRSGRLMECCGKRVWEDQPGLKTFREAKLVRGERCPGRDIAAPQHSIKRPAKRSNVLTETAQPGVAKD